MCKICGLYILGAQVHEVEVRESIGRMTVIKLLTFMAFAVQITGEKKSSCLRHKTALSI